MKHKITYRIEIAGQRYTFYKMRELEIGANKLLKKYPQMNGKIYEMVGNKKKTIGRILSYGRSKWYIWGLEQRFKKEYIMEVKPWLMQELLE